jgi:hypothetical protein
VKQASGFRENGSGSDHTVLAVGILEMPRHRGPLADFGLDSLGLVVLPLMRLVRHLHHRAQRDDC